MKASNNNIKTKQQEFVPIDTSITKVNTISIINAINIETIKTVNIDLSLYEIMNEFLEANKKFGLRETHYKNIYNESLAKLESFMMSDKPLESFLAKYLKAIALFKLDNLEAATIFKDYNSDRELIKAELEAFEDDKVVTELIREVRESKDHQELIVKHLEDRIKSDPKLHDYYESFKQLMDEALITSIVIDSGEFETSKPGIIAPTTELLKSALTSLPGASLIVDVTQKLVEATYDLHKTNQARFFLSNIPTISENLEISNLIAIQLTLKKSQEISSIAKNKEENKFFQILDKIKGKFVVELLNTPEKALGYHDAAIIINLCKYGIIKHTNDIDLEQKLIHAVLNDGDKFDYSTVNDLYEETNLSTDIHHLHGKLHDKLVHVKGAISRKAHEFKEEVKDLSHKLIHKVCTGESGFPKSGQISVNGGFKCTIENKIQELENTENVSIDTHNRQDIGIQVSHSDTYHNYTHINDHNTYDTEYNNTTLDILGSTYKAYEI